MRNEDSLHPPRPLTWRLAGPAMVVFGAGLVVAQDGNDAVGIALLTAGYLALPARSVYRLLPARNQRT